MGWLGDFLFPKKCVICDKPGVMICDGCFERLDTATKKCPMCSRPSRGGVTHVGCIQKLGMEGLKGVWSYKDPLVRKVIKGIKYRGYKELIGEIMTRIENDVREELIVPIPLFKKRENERGFNQAEVIGKFLGKEKLTEVLARSKKTRPLAEMRSREERAEEIEGAFEIIGDKKKIKGKSILLVDDVFTSGATMREAAKVLKENGAKEVWGFVLAS